MLLSDSLCRHLQVYCRLLSDCLCRQLQVYCRLLSDSLCRQLQVCCKLLSNIYLTIWVKSGLYVLRVLGHLLMPCRGRQHLSLQRNFFVDFWTLEVEGTAVFLTLLMAYPPLRKVPSRGGEKDFSPLHRVRTGSGTVRGDPCLGVKRPGREADHLRLSSAEVQNFRSCCLHTPSGDA